MVLCSGDEDQAQERINKLAKILKGEEVGSSLRAAGVGVISCIIQRDEGRAPMRHSFHWPSEKHYYEEEPLLRHLEPPLSIYLELVCHSPLVLPFGFPNQPPTKKNIYIYTHYGFDLKFHNICFDSGQA